MDDVITYLEQIKDSSDKKRNSRKFSIILTLFYIGIYSILLSLIILHLGGYNGNSFLLISLLFFSIIISLFSYRYKNFESLLLNIFIILSMIFLFIYPSFILFLSIIFSLIIYLAILIFRKYEYKNFWFGVSLVFLFLLFVLSKLNLVANLNTYKKAENIAKETQYEAKQSLGTTQGSLFFITQGIRNSLYEAFLPIINPEEYQKKMNQVVGKETKKLENLGIKLDKFESSFPLYGIETVPIYLFMEFSLLLDPNLKKIIEKFDKNSKIKITISCSLEKGDCSLKNNKTIANTEIILRKTEFIDPLNNILKKFYYVFKVEPYKDGNLNITFDYNYFQYGEGSIDLNNFKNEFIQLKSLLNIGTKLNKVQDYLIGYLSLNDFSNRLNDGSINKIKKIDNITICFNLVNNREKVIKSISSLEYGKWKEENYENNLQCFKLSNNKYLNFKNTTFKFVNLPIKIEFNKNVIEKYKSSIVYFFILVEFNVEKTILKYVDINENKIKDFTIQKNIEKLEELCSKYNDNNCKDSEKLYEKLKDIWNIKDKNAFMLLNSLINQKKGELKEVFRKLNLDENGIRFFVLSQVYIESSFDPNAKNYNEKSGSVDRGLFQINNKYHKECDDNCAYDIEKAFDYYIKIYKEQIIPYLEENNCLSIENAIRSYNGGPCCWKEKKCSKDRKVYAKTEDYLNKWKNNFEKISVILS